MTTTTAPPKTTTSETKKVIHSKKPLLHYAAYFIGIGSLVFIAQSDEPRQLETALLAGAISSGSVISRDWFKARLDPSMANDPGALISLFNEMLHAGRAQVNANAAHLKRVEFLQTDLTEAMRSFNDLLRLSPEEIEQRLQSLQGANLTHALSAIEPPAPAENGHIPPAGETHRQESTTLRQSFRQHRPGFDA
ncbi:MAG: hypothetical protein AAGN15_23850 [Cyanobacteria bacterium J06581_3]